MDNDTSIPFGFAPAGDRAAAINAAIDSMVGVTNGVSVADPGQNNATVSVAPGMAALDGLTADDAYRYAQEVAAKDDGSADFASIAMDSQQRFDAAQAALAEVTYDKKTGQKSFALQGLARQQQEDIVKRLQVQFILDGFVAKAVANVRADRAANQALDEQVAALEQEFSKGDPVRAAALQAATLRVEAEDAALRLVNLRRTRVR